MLRMLAVVILLAVILPVSGQKTSSGANSSKTEPVEINTSPPSNYANCSIKQDGTAIECKWARAAPETKLSRLFSAENIPNIGMFFVTLAAVCAAVSTLKVIKRQAVSMRRQTTVFRTSADATLLNAQAVMNAERAWVSVEEVTGDPRRKQTALAVALLDVKFKNTGRSPAFVVDEDSKGKVLDLGVSLPDRPDLTESLDIKKVEGFPIPPGRFYGIRNIDGGILIREPKKLESSEKVLWVYGFLKYRDVFGRIQETWYCFRWQSNFGLENDPIWVMDGPPSYNRVTYQYGIDSKPKLRPKKRKWWQFWKMKRKANKASSKAIA